MRLFGQVYNDRVKPENPFEFMDLLGGADMISVQRNRMMEEPGRRIRRNPRLAESLRRGRRKGWTRGSSRPSNLSWTNSATRAGARPVLTETPRPYSPSC